MAKISKSKKINPKGKIKITFPLVIGIIILILGSFLVALWGDSFFIEIAPKEINLQPTPIKEELTSPIPTQTDREKVRVVSVIDGDTIQLENGETLRYIGIDAPETVHQGKPVQCYGQEASLENKKLVEGKEIEVEKDVSEKDQYGRILRYVWAEGIFVNEYLVREGFAQAVTFPPDVKYQEQFLEAERKAREEGKGLWSGVCQN